MERLSMLSGSRAVVGEPAPKFCCKAVVDGRIRELNSHKLSSDGKWILLVFFPMAWSFVCPTEIIAFSGALADFSARHCAVLFVSTDNEFVLRAWNSMDAEEGGLGHSHVALVSDRSHRICRDYGVLLEEEGIARRATFFIDPSGIIRFMSCNDSNVGRSVEESKRILDALRFTDEFGDACPADWKAGDMGIRIPSYKNGSSEHSGSATEGKEVSPSVTSQQQQQQGGGLVTASSMRPNLSRTVSWTSNWVKAGKASKPESPGVGKANFKGLPWTGEENVI